MEKTGRTEGEWKSYNNVYDIDYMKVFDLP